MIQKLTTNRLLWLLIVVALAFVTGCRKDEAEEVVSSKLAAAYDADIPVRWNRLFLDVDRYAPGYRPPAAARMLAYTGLAAYEAAVPGMPNYQSMEDKFPGLRLPEIEPGRQYHWPSAVNAAYAAMFKYFFPHVDPAYLVRINQLEQRVESEFANSGLASDVLSRSANFGREVADAVARWSETDTPGHEAFRNPRPTSYTPPTTGPNGEVLWQPTVPDFTRALFPYWGNVRPFAIHQNDKIARPPIPFSENPNSQFYNQANEIRLWVNNATYDDRWIAEFWSDDIFELTFEPAARLISIANQLAAEDQISLERAVELYVMLGMALCDAGIAVWHSKYLYNVERPVQYIRRVMDPNWVTILNDPINNLRGVTPPFPAYPSGHSGFGGAGSAILAYIFNNRPFTDRSHEDRNEFIGTPRYYTNIFESGVENAYSRLPLGVHFRMDCDEGLRLGYLAASRVIDMPWKK